MTDSAQTIGSTKEIRSSAVGEDRASPLLAIAAPATVERSGLLELEALALMQRRVHREETQDHPQELPPQPSRGEVFRAVRAFTRELATIPLSAGQLVTAYWSLGQLRIYPSELLAHLDERVLGLTQSLDLDGSARIIWGCGKMGHRNLPSLDALGKTVAQSLDELAAGRSDPLALGTRISSLPQIVSGLGRIRYDPIIGPTAQDTLIARIAELLIERQSVFTPRQLVSTAYGALMLERDRDARNLLQLAIARGEESTFRRVELNQIRAIAVLTDSPLPDQIAAAVVEADAESRRLAPKESQTSFEITVGERLREFIDLMKQRSGWKELHLEAQAYIEGHPADFLIRRGTQPLAAVEVNGAQHYVNRKRRDGYIGPDIVQDRLMQRKGIPVIHIFNGWASRRDEQIRAGTHAKLLAALVQRLEARLKIGLESSPARE